MSDSNGLPLKSLEEAGKFSARLCAKVCSQKNGDAGRDRLLKGPP